MKEAQGDMQMIVNLKQNGDPAENTRILQQSLDHGGTVRIDQPGTYDFEGCLTIGDNTALECGAGVFLRRVGEVTGPLPPFIANKGIYDDTVNHNIRLEGIHLIVNGVDHVQMPLFPGLRGHLGFIGVRQLVIRDFECHDLEKSSYGIHVCNFEDILIENVFIEGLKDGIHLGQGSKFTIRHAKFRTFDDPIALNAYDYCTSNARFGWLEDGLIEDCYDLNDKDTTGFFCRLLAGSWCDWYDGMPYQNSTLTVYQGKLYAASVRPIAKRDKPLLSHTPPPQQPMDLINYQGVGWRLVQEHDGKYDAGCRRITFRDIFLQKTRKVAFAFELSNGPWAVSVPDGLPIPVQEDFVFDGIYSGSGVGHLLELDAPCKNIRISNSTIDGDAILNRVLPGRETDYFQTDITITGSAFKRNADLLRGTPTKHISINLNACNVIENGELTCEGEANIEAGNIKTKKI